MGIDFAPENVMTAALEILSRQNVILAWRKSQKNGELDADGVDFVIYLKSGLILPVQTGGPNKDVELHLARHPHVRFIVKICSNRPNFLAETLKRFVEKIDLEVASFCFGKRKEKYLLITLR